MKRIVFVTSGQPAANPRLVKEVRWISLLNVSITVIYAPISAWADQLDAGIRQELNHVQWISVAGSARENPVHHFWIRLRRKGWELIARILNGRLSTGAKALSLFSQELRAVACRYPADAYIGHNLGALPAVVEAAKVHHAKACFDAEDFHAGEMPQGSWMQRLVLDLERRYLPGLNGRTVSSPLIHSFYQQQYPQLDFVMIPNVFPFRPSQAHDLEVKEGQYPLNLVWFSQFVGKERGIEIALAAMGKCKDIAIRLSLVGNISASTARYFFSLAQLKGVDANDLSFVGPLSEDQLTEFCSRQDVGLALENDHRLNNSICWSNKLFFYPSVGIPTVISATKGQLIFLETYPDVGSIFPIGDVEELARLFHVYANDSALRMHQQQSIREQFLHRYETVGENWRNYLQAVLSS